jgi:phage tail tape-measure protein
MLGAVAGAAAGAALGALAGPVGLAAGAVAGAVLGGVAGGNTVDRLDRNAARYVAGSGPERPDNDGGDRPLAGKNTDRPR